MSAREARTQPGPVVAIGGGSLSVSPRVPLGFAAVMLSVLPPLRSIRILYLGTASKDDLRKERDALALFDRLSRERHVKFEVVHVADLASADVTASCMNADIIYVGSGNTAFAMDTWRVYGVDHMLRKAWEKGVACAGSSAGALCWFDRFVTDSFGEPRVIAGLGLVQGVAAAHYDTYPKGRALLRADVMTARRCRGVGIADGSAVVVKPNNSLVALNLRSGKSMQVTGTSSGALEEVVDEIDWQRAIMEEIG